MENVLAGRYRELLEQTVQTPPVYPIDRFQGRGILVCGGGEHYFPNVWICIRMLRRAGCTLPIELWHRGPREMSVEMKEMLAPYQVDVRDAFAVAREYPVRSLDGWELKPYAIANSRFVEVLYIDADNVVVRDPEYLFNAKEYLHYGALFWPDLPFKNAEEWTLQSTAWKVMNVPFRTEPEFEAGQMVIDKRRCWMALQLTLHLNEHSDYYYRFFFGDKDTFHLAWRKLRQDFGFVSRPPTPLGANLVLIQTDPSGERLFQHRCNAKWTLNGSNERIRGFLFEEECLEYLRELRSLWRPDQRDHTFAHTPVEQIAFDEITETGVFDAFIDGHPGGSCSIRPDGTITFGDDTHGWETEEDKDGEAVLIVTRQERRLCFLRKTAPGVWAGLWRYAERRPLELRSRDHGCQ